MVHHSKEGVIQVLGVGAKSLKQVSVVPHDVHRGEPKKAIVVLIVVDSTMLTLALLLFQVCGHELGVRVDLLHHDEEVVVAADHVVEELAGLDMRLKAADQQQEELAELLKAATLSKQFCQ